ncbi:MAG: lamin tail domain-containing protein [Clostridia bacterium]|nr:lamin tail domain-containing protein [Clostridia bacterium]
MSEPRRRRSAAAQERTEAYDRPIADGMRTGRDVQKRSRIRARARVMTALIAVVGLMVVLLGGYTVYALSKGYDPFTDAKQARIGTASSTEMNAAAEESYYKGLRISEVMPSNHTSVPDETGSFSDWLEIWNSSDHDIDLEHVGLCDRSDSIRFLFPQMILPPDGRLVVFCDNENRSEPYSVLHAKFKLSSVGETVYLYEPHAMRIDAVTFDMVGTDRSWALLPDGRWAEVAYFSPGYENTEEGHERYRLESMVMDGALIINEVSANARCGLTDEDGDLTDWIELYNTTDQTIFLDNYALSDKENQPLRWRFPAGASVAPHGYYIVFCSGKDRAVSPTSIPHASFRISAEHDTVVLSDHRGHICDRVIVDNLPEDCTWARDPSGSFTVHTFATPGRSNEDVAGADTDLRRWNTSGVIISEVMASNDSVGVADGNAFVDWVEIRNTGLEAVDLSGWGLSDRIGRPRKWQFPYGTWIEPGQIMVILCDGLGDTAKDGRLHTNFRIQRGGGETVCLCTPEGRILDKLLLSAIPTNVSYGRTLGTSGFFYYDTPTPGTENVGGFLGYCGTPSFTNPPGLYEVTGSTPMISTRITIPENTTVRYTTDGSVPTLSSTVYQGEELLMQFTTVIRARAFSDSGLLKDSEVLTGTFLINAYHTLPIFSIVTDPDILWNETNGMLTVGQKALEAKAASPAAKLPFKYTVYREVKDKMDARPVHVEYYSLDGQQILNQDAEFKLMGDFSLDMPQKSMKFRAKSIYGNKTFAAALFEDRQFTEYKGFVLRNSGNDSMWTRLLDGFESRLVDAYQAYYTRKYGYGEDTIPVIHQAWKPVVVYLNGVYWGHMNLRERNDRFMAAQQEGLPLSEAANMTILQGSGILKYGTRSELKEYQAFIKQVKNGKPAMTNGQPNKDLQYILDNVDVDNYFEYISLEMFFGNSDIGNLRFYRLHREDSKWRWILYDVDYGLFTSSFNSPRSYTKAKGMGDKNIDNTILLKLLSVPEYKDKFLRKYASVFEFLTTDTMLEILEPLVELITPEMSVHWARWGPENDKKVIDEVPVTGDGAYRYWQKRVDRLRNTLRKRPRNLWEYTQAAFSLNNQQMINYFGPQPEYGEGAY